VIPVTMARLKKQSRLRELLRGEDGQSAVEFALTAPTLLLVVTGITAFGIAFNNYIMLTEATAVAARELTASRGQTLDPCNTFASAVYAAAPLLKESNLTFTISLDGNSYSGTSCSGTSTSGAPANMILGTNAEVQVTYPFNLSVFGIQIVPSGSLLTARTTEVMQ
jgi:Flp pilus assembly protein TadG